LQGESVLLLET